jgi:hypothetical protein
VLRARCSLSGGAGAALPAAPRRPPDGPSCPFLEPSARSAPGVERPELRTPCPDVDRAARRGRAPSLRVRRAGVRSPQLRTLDLGSRAEFRRIALRRSRRGTRLPPTLLGGGRRDGSSSRRSARRDVLRSPRLSGAFPTASREPRCVAIPTARLSFRPRRPVSPIGIECLRGLRIALPLPPARSKEIPCPTSIPLS